MAFFAGTYAEVFSITEGPPLHDPLAVSAAIYPEIFNDQCGERFEVEVVTEGVHSSTQTDVGELGRTKVTKLPSGKGGCRIPRSVDLDKFWGSIESALMKADAVSPMSSISREDLEKVGVFVGID
jgi:uridine nucleosidase